MPASLTPPIRTITLGIAESHPLSAAVLKQARDRLEYVQARYAEAGYEVQTIRLATRPLFDDLAQKPVTALLEYARELQHMLDDLGLHYCSLGPAQATRPNFPLQLLECLVDILTLRPALSATVQIATLEQGLHREAAQMAGLVIERLGQVSDAGMGNFRFAVLACVSPGTPFFPAAYHSGPSSFSLGLQGAGLVTNALQEHASELVENLNFAHITHWIRDAMIASATPLVTLAQNIAQDLQVQFGGIDLSPAPMGDDSIVPALEVGGHGSLDGAGTLSTVAAITAALKSTTLPTCGYCGLMLPVLEDALLAQRWEEGHINIYQLLLFSSLSGVGLDMIPLAGNTSADTIARLLMDMAVMALRLQKPLSARLLPVPGKNAGERTEFVSPYLTNTVIQP